MGRLSIPGVVVTVACLLTAAAPPSLAGGNGCGCSPPRYASCCDRPSSMSCYAAPRKQWIPSAPQGMLVPSTAAFAVAQPALMVSPQVVTGQALSLQTVSPQFVSASALAAPSVFSSSLLTAPAFSSRTSSGMSVSQLAKALKAVAESEAAAAQAAEKECSSSASALAASEGGTVEQRLDRLEKSVESLTQTSQEILTMIKLHEERLQKIEDSGK